MPKTASDQFMYNEHKRKPVIRINWCLPQIKEMANKFKKKLVYVGLPGIDAHDIKAWIEFLERVIAFQCAEYKKGRSKVTVDVKLLDNYFEQLEREGKLKSGKVYEGFMEDIVMGGLSDRGEKYTQTDFIKLYNLDFCNNLTTPRTIYNEVGRTIHQYYKLQAIEELLKFQTVISVAGKGNRFVMYLTVNAEEFTESVADIKEKPYLDYFAKLKKIKKPSVVNVRMTKAYCHYKLKKIFNAQKFNIEFLPPIFYLGSGYPNKNGGNKEDHHQMMSFTVLGTKLSDGSQFYEQDVTAFLDSKFVFASDTGLKPYTDNFIVETDFKVDPLEMLKASYSYATLW